MRKTEHRMSAKRIELCATAALELSQRLLQRQCRTVRAVGKHRVNRICHADDPADERNVVAFWARRIACAVVALVMVARAAAQLRHGCDILQDALANLRMLADDAIFVFGELVRFFENVLRHADLADIVQQRRVVEVAVLHLAPAQRPADAQGVLRDIVGMALLIAVPGVDGVGESRDRLDRQALDLHRLAQHLCFQLVFQDIEFHDALHATQHDQRCEGLGDKILRAEIQAFFLHFRVGNAGQKDDRDSAEAVSSLACPCHSCQASLYPSTLCPEDCAWRIRLLRRRWKPC